VFHDPALVAATEKFRGFAPIGWLLAIPTKFGSLLLCRPMPNIYPGTQKALLRAFRRERGSNLYKLLPKSIFFVR
jgi:hypothetical protein